MAGEFTVDTVPLAEYIAENGIAHIDFMKIDTEGADLSVLRGLGDALNVIDTLLLEVHSNRDVDECQAIWEFLSDGELIHIDTGDQVAGPEELSGAKVLWES